LKTLFDIQSGGEAESGLHLLLEAGKDYCSYGLWERAANAMHRLRYTTFAETNATEHFSEIIDEVKDSKFESVYISSGFPQALLYPTSFFKGDFDVLNVIYDQASQAYLHDAIPEWQMVNAYAMPSSMHEILQQAFPSSHFVHAYTPTIKVYNGYTAENQLSVHFVPDHFRVVLKKGSTVHLAQTYRYETPLDVIYYLLKICYEFSLEQSAVYLILSGLIEKASALFIEIEQYFINVHFAHPPALRLPESEHPHYFFTSLYNLAQCVS
jgi:hypothetical protein